MLISDSIYGKEEITEPVLLELINSQEVQRLKNISQQGLPQKYYHWKVYSRYVHSLGVFLLLRKLGADLKEQIAGLLHDVSHTAFSHVFDWLVGDPLKEDYQDNIHLQTIKKSSLAKILKKYGYNPQKIAHTEKFTILEQELPQLCADRIDYALRDSLNFFPKEKALFCFQHLTIKDKKIVFDLQKAAEEFAQIFAHCQSEFWGGKESRARYLMLSKILRLALEQKIIHKNDFKKTDQEIIDKLWESKNKEIMQTLYLLEKRLSIVQGGMVLPNNKFRSIDPEIILKNKVVPLTQISPQYQRLLKEKKKENEEILKIKIIGN